MLVGVFFIFATAAYWIFERDRAIGSCLVGGSRDRRRVIRDTWELIDAKLGAFVRGQLLLVTFVATVLSLASGRSDAVLAPARRLCRDRRDRPGDRADRGRRARGWRRPDRVVARRARRRTRVLVVRQLEDYVVIPRVMGHVTGLSPLLVLVSVPRWACSSAGSTCCSRSVRRGAGDPRGRDRARQGPRRRGRAGGAVRERGARPCASGRRSGRRG